MAIVGWIVLNLSLLVSGAHILDEPPFPYLADAASIIALYLTTIILIAQRHDDDLATRRDQLTLELAILAEQKSTKISRNSERPIPKRFPNRLIRKPCSVMARPDPKTEPCGLRAVWPRDDQPR